MISNVFSAIGKFCKGLVKRLEKLEINGRIETTQAIELLKSVKILESWEDLLSLRRQ